MNRPARGRIAAVIAMVVMASIFVPALARASSVAVTMFERVLVYDRAIKGRSKNAVVIAVVYQAGDPESEQWQRTVIAAVNNDSTTRIEGLPLSAVAISFTPSFADAIASSGAAAAFLCPGLGDSLGKITTVARNKHVLTVGMDEDYVLDGGVSVAIVGADQPGAPLNLTINVSSAKAEGAELSTNLLRLARVVK